MKKKKKRKTSALIIKIFDYLQEYIRLHDRERKKRQREKRKNFFFMQRSLFLRYFNLIKTKLLFFANN